MEPSLQDRYAPHSRCFGCGPENPKGLRIKSFVRGEEVVCELAVEPQHQAFEGFVAGGILAQAGVLGLNCGFKSALTAAEQTAVRQVTLTPSGDYCHAIVAVGHRPADLDGDGDVDATDVGALGGCMSGPDVEAAPGCDPADVDGDGDVDLADFSQLQPD